MGSGGVGDGGSPSGRPPQAALGSGSGSGPATAARRSPDPPRPPQPPRGHHRRVQSVPAGLHKSSRMACSASSSGSGSEGEEGRGRGGSMERVRGRGCGGRADALRPGQLSLQPCLGGLGAAGLSDSTLDRDVCCLGSLRQV